MPLSSTFLVAIDGQALPADVVPLLTYALVDDSQRLPDMFALRFRDSERVVVAKTGVKVGSTVTVSVQTTDSKTPQGLVAGEVTALEAEFDAAGTFTVIRGYDPAHRLFRGRHSASYAQMTASDIVTKVARRAGLKVGAVQSTATVFEHVSQLGTTDWEFLESLARETGYEITVRDSGLSFAPPQTAVDAPSAPGPAATEPLALRMGADLLRLRSVVTSAQQVKEVEVRGWDVAGKQPLSATAPARTLTAELADVTPASMAAAFGDPTYVATDVPYGTQSEVETVAVALSEEIAGSFAECEGVARGNPLVRAGSAVSISGLGSPFDGKYTVSTSRHRYDPAGGYTTAFSVTGRQERSLFGLTSSGRGSPRGPAGVVVGVVSDVQDPAGLGSVKVTFPWLDQDYTSTWARTVQPGAGKDRGWMVLPEVGDEVLVAFEQGDARRPYVLGGLYNGVDLPPAHAPDLVDGGTGAVNRRSLVSRQGHRVDLLDQSGKADGIVLETSGGTLAMRLDAAKTEVTVRSDGTVRIEGSKGVVVDASSSDLELKAGKVAITATNGVSLDGGGGAVSVKTGGQLTLSGTTAKLEGSGTTEVKGGGMCSISAAIVKIN